MISTHYRVAEAQPDVLGPGYESIALDFPGDASGPARATLIRRRAPTPSHRAVLYVHGFADYFFQTELAEFHTGRGVDFYALDLRGYGRSLLPGQTPYQMTDVADYVPELEAALAIITADGHTAVTVSAHSTGGLIVALWLADRGDLDPVDSLVLNAPFLELNADRLMRAMVGAGVGVVSRVRPLAVLPLPDPGLYGRSLHVSLDGEWEFNQTWKPLIGVPVRAGWLAAVRRAQQRLINNLGLTCPILVLCSTNTFRGRRWTEAAMSGDAVLDADRTADLSTRLGRHVTCVRIPDALHDVLLSRPAVRGHAYAEIGAWLTRYQVG